MCGIFGTINYKLSASTEVFRGLFHRGPDAQQSVDVNNVQLYHTRLAIQDLSPAGVQPMEEDGIYIVFNGEIYNHMELRNKYKISSSSNSDTRTILLLYQKMGMRMLEEFDGMFAFALYDSKKGSLFLARDRAGKKPLYLYNNGSKFVFSSELNTLYNITRASVNYDSLSEYLYLGYHYRKSTPYTNVTEVENGYYVQINTETCECSIKKWFDLTECYKNNTALSYQESLEELDERLHIAIKRRLESSDLDVGSFLSGGIDSGLVTAIASKYAPQLKTFTVKIEGAYDESSLASLVAKKYNTQHTTVDISFADLNKDIESLLINYGEPYCDSSAIPSYYVAKAAKKHITVVLNGDGADELFGGYRRYVPFKHFDFFNKGRASTLTAKCLVNLLPIANEKKSSYNYIYRLLKFASYTNPLKMYSSASSDIFVGYEDVFLRQPKLEDITAGLHDIADLDISSLKKLLLMDFQTILFSGLLPKMDIATMAHSLEGRSPFLSKELLEFAPGIKDNYKIHKVTTKYILRDLAKKYLPDELINQPKRGFEIPLKSWVNSNLKEMIDDYLLSADTVYPQLIKKSFIEDLLRDKVKISAERRAKILFCVFGLEVWYKNIRTMKMQH